MAINKFLFYCYAFFIVKTLLKKLNLTKVLFVAVRVVHYSAE